MKRPSRQMIALVPIAVIACNLTACGSDVPESSNAPAPSDASTPTRPKGTAVKGAPVLLEKLMESGRPQGKDYRYTAEHIWVTLTGDTAEIGLTNFAQTALGDIVYLGLPNLGTQCKANGPCGVVESTKSVIDIYSPLTGVVTEVNTDLVLHPGKIDTDPYGSWLIRMRISDLAEFESLPKQPF
jgi:glycine cleavage system H protein